MIGRLRQILPFWTIVVFAVIFLLLEGPVLYFEWRLGRCIVELKYRPGTVLLYGAAAFYGIHRGITLHPFYREDYRKWLELTPWTVHKPLPLGPIALVGEDGVVLGVLILLCLTQPNHVSIRILNLFLIIHSVVLTRTFWQTGPGTIGYIAAVGLGLTVRLWHSPWPCFAVAASVYLVVYEGLWQSLARFPWHVEWWLSDLLDAGKMRTVSERLNGPPCGWPYDRFIRDIKVAERARLSGIDAILISLLAGWWICCLLALIPDPRDRSGVGTIALFVVGIFTPLFRLVTYVGFYHDSISLWGRLRTGRWINPGYDRCFLGPLLSLLAGPLVFLPCYASRTPVEISVALSSTVVILLGLITPPGLKDWRLTGKHRIIPGQPPQGSDPEFIKVG
jgi:hypothetical protein